MCPGASSLRRGQGPKGVWSGAVEELHRWEEQSPAGTQDTAAQDGLEGRSVNALDLSYPQCQPGLPRVP